MGFFDALTGKSSIKASNKKVKGLQAGIGAIDEGFETAEGLFNPIIQQGSGANQLLSDALGVNGGGNQAQFFADFQGDPGTQFLIDRGEQGILRNAAATGGRQSGRTLADLAQFGQGIASQELLNRLRFLSSLGGQQVSGAGTLAQLAAGRGANVANLEGQIGSAKAGGILGKANQQIGLFQGGLDLLGSALGGGAFGGGFGGGGGPTSIIPTGAPNFNGGLF